jgi:hypothetical protein
MIGVKMNSYECNGYYSGQAFNLFANTECSHFLFSKGYHIWVTRLQKNRPMLGGIELEHIGGLFDEIGQHSGINLSSV